MREFARIEADKLKHLVDTGGGARVVPIFQSGNKGYIFCNGEMGKKTGILDDITYATAEADEIPIAG